MGLSVLHICLLPQAPHTTYKAKPENLTKVYNVCDTRKVKTMTCFQLDSKKKIKNWFTSDYSNIHVFINHLWMPSCNINAIHIYTLQCCNWKINVLNSVSDNELGKEEDLFVIHGCYFLFFSIKNLVTSHKNHLQMRGHKFML